MNTQHTVQTLTSSTKKCYFVYICCIQERNFKVFSKFVLVFHCRKHLVTYSKVNCFVSIVLNIISVKIKLIQLYFRLFLLPLEASINGKSISVPIVILKSRPWLPAVVARVVFSVGCVGVGNRGSTSAREISQTGNLFGWAGEPLISQHSVRSSTYSRLDKFERYTLILYYKKLCRTFTILPDLHKELNVQISVNCIMLLLKFLDNFYPYRAMVGKVELNVIGWQITIFAVAGKLI